MNVYVLIFMSFISGLALTIFGERVFVRKFNWKLVLRNRHIHHSTYGAIVTMVGTYLAFTDYVTASIFLIFGGLGMVAEHTRSEKRLVFIEKILK